MSVSAHARDDSADGKRPVRLGVTRGRPADSGEVADVIRIDPTTLGLNGDEVPEDLEAVMNPSDPFDRAVIRLRYDEQQTLTAIAQALNTSPDVVSRALMAIYRRIASALSGTAH